LSKSEAKPPGEKPKDTSVVDVKQEKTSRKKDETKEKEEEKSPRKAAKKEGEGEEKGEGKGVKIKNEKRSIQIRRVKGGLKIRRAKQDRRGEGEGEERKEEKKEAEGKVEGDERQQQHRGNLSHREAQRLPFSLQPCATRALRPLTTPLAGRARVTEQLRSCTALTPFHPLFCCALQMISSAIGLERVAGVAITAAARSQRTGPTSTSTGAHGEAGTNGTLPPLRLSPTCGRKHQSTRAADTLCSAKRADSQVGRLSFGSALKLRIAAAPGQALVENSWIHPGPKMVGTLLGPPVSAVPCGASTISLAWLASHPASEVNLLWT
jgi:hypothetical protein